jgi:predicted tellurium resistance membrane protein TerC
MLLVFGLLLSIAFMAFFATMIMKVMSKYTWLSWLGLIFLVYLAAAMLHDGWPEIAALIGMGGAH